jgi:Uncharacterized protein containing a von Willebrand factor type A (vWA) domain
MKSFITLLLLCAGTALLHAQTITGKITDEKDTPIQGASIILKGANTSTTSDVNGYYSIQASGNNVILVFACVGFDTQEIKLNGKTVVNVRLKPSVKKLDEVVVIGYGKGTKRSVVGGMPLSGRVPGISVSGNRGHNRQRYDDIHDREGYDHIQENSFRKVSDHPLSTFSIDVDAASYSNVRRILNQGRLPTPGAVRIEEMINYFSYNYPQPADDKPFSITTEWSSCPWNEGHQLVMIGLQGRKLDAENLPPSNLVFLIDVSGSMQTYNKLPLVKSSLNLLADQLRPQDKISIVVYAGNAGLVLPATNDKYRIREAVNSLEAGGSTAGGAGIQLAYQVAQQHFMENGNNRVVLCTDGDFNVGTSSDDELVNIIEKKRASGVYLTVLGFGSGNYQDAKMQKLADKGNGNHAYIDNINEAKKVLISEFGGTMFTIAKDVKLQVEFNPAKVKAYRLVGYENRMLAKEDFNNDKKDAGEMGSNHTVTALYEIIPAESDEELATVDPLRYQKPKKKAGSLSDELMFVKIRYKNPKEQRSNLVEVPVQANSRVASDNMQFASAVAAFGMVLRKSEFKGSSSYKLVQSLAADVNDGDAYKKEFLELVKKAEQLEGMAKAE